MQIIERTHKLEYFESRILEKYLGGMRMAVLDIETLGLYPKHEPVILVGLMSVAGDGTAISRQFFAESASTEEETALLEAVSDELASYDHLLTYNGRRFDIPYLKVRAEKLGVNGLARQLEMFNLDLFMFVKHYSALPHFLPNLRQKSIEEYLGLKSSRDDEISGGESVILYQELEKLNALEIANELSKLTGSNAENPLAREVQISDIDAKKAAISEKILLHNHDDLVQLYKILPVIMETAIHIGFNKQGFPLAGVCGWPNLNVKKIKLSASSFTVSGVYVPRSYKGSQSAGPAANDKALNDADDSISFTSFSTPERPYNVHFAPDGSFMLEIPSFAAVLEASTSSEDDSNTLDLRAQNELATMLLARFMHDNPLT